MCWCSQPAGGGRAGVPQGGGAGHLPTREGDAAGAQVPGGEEFF